MINDNEGMDNALEYYVDGDNTSYWKEFVRRLDDRLERRDEKKLNEEMQSYWGDWTDEDPYDVTNVDSDEDYEEANGVSEEQDDDYYDYDDEWEDFDWDNEELEKEKDNNNEKQ